MIGFSFPFKFATVSIFIYGTPVYIVKRNVVILPAQFSRPFPV